MQTDRLLASVVLPLPSVMLSPTTTRDPDSGADHASTAETKYLDAQPYQCCLFARDGVRLTYQ